MSTCDRCPCPGSCLGWPSFCAWAAEDPQDPVKIRTIVRRSAPDFAHEPVATAPEYPSAAQVAANLASAKPGPLEVAGNFVGAMGRVIAAAARGEPVKVPADILGQRRALCLPCEFNGLRDSGDIRCLKCGCPGAKLTYATEECPVGKWPRWRP